MLSKWWLGKVNIVDFSVNVLPRQSFYIPHLSVSRLADPMDCPWRSISMCEDEQGLDDS